MGIRSAFWEIGYEDYTELPLDPVDTYDVVFMGNEYSAKRTLLGHILRNLKDVRVGLYGEWKSVTSNGKNQYDFRDADYIYRCSKIAISDNQYPNAIGYISNRIFQSMRAGSFILQQKTQEMESLLGIVDGVHLATWDTLEDLPSKIQYWLDRPDERRAIAEAGKEKCLRDFSFRARVSELEKILYDTFTAKNDKIAQKLG
jgi:spore maturation protein CgeB